MAWNKPALMFKFLMFQLIILTILNKFLHLSTQSLLILVYTWTTKYSTHNCTKKVQLLHSYTVPTKFHLIVKNSILQLAHQNRLSLTMDIPTESLTAFCRKHKMQILQTCSLADQPNIYTIYYQNKFSPIYKIKEQFFKQIIKNNPHCTSESDQLKFIICFKSHTITSFVIKNNHSQGTYPFKLTKIIYKHTCRLEIVSSGLPHALGWLHHIGMTTPYYHTDFQHTWSLTD